jgi:WhiB family redox-sensing transcriptional regulator
VTTPRAARFVPSVARAIAAEIAFPNPHTGGSSYRTKRPVMVPRRTVVIRPALFTIDEARIIVGQTTSVRGAWRLSALCRDVDPTLFFPPPGESQKQVKAICAQCPVQAECLLHALNNREYWGVWGGLSERERRTLRRRRGKARR